MRILIGCTSQTLFLSIKEKKKKNMPVKKMIGSCIKMHNKMHYAMTATRFQLSQVISSWKLKFVDKHPAYLGISHVASNCSKLSMKLFS